MSGLEKALAPERRPEDMRSRSDGSDAIPKDGPGKGADLRTLRLVLTWVAFCCILTACDYGRMKEQESVRTYEAQLPEMPSGTVPVEGGVERLMATDPRNLMDPLGGLSEARRPMAITAPCATARGGMAGALWGRASIPSPLT